MSDGGTPASESEDLLTKALGILSEEFKEGLVPKTVLVRLLGKLSEKKLVTECLVQMADKFCKADVRVEDFLEDLRSWHARDTSEDLRKELSIGNFASWCTSADLETNLRKIQSVLRYDEEASPGGASASPESTHGSDKDQLEVGMKIRLNLSKEELQQRSADWQPHDATMLRHVCFVGPGEKQLKELDSIAKGRHWIEFGILFSTHSLPTRKTDAGAGQGLQESYDYGTGNEDVASKYPRLDKIAEALKQDGASSRARFCAHLLGEPFDTCLLDDGSQSFLNWLVECGFQKVLLDWSRFSSSPEVKDRTDAEVDRCAERLLRLMNDFEKLVFVLSIRDHGCSNRQGERLLDRLLGEAKPAKIQVLYNSSRGLGEKSTIYKCPESRDQDRLVGYAGGLGPGNVVQQLDEMRWVVPQGRHVFIEAQSGVRDKKQDEFSIPRCLEFAKKIAESSFNPAKGGEVYPQFDGSLVLGDSDTKVLYPDTDYEVTDIEQLTFSVKPAGTEQTANVFIAGSIAARYFALVGTGGGLLPPLLKNDRPGVKKECTPSSPVSADIIRDYLQPPRRSTLKIVRSPAANGPPYHGKTPLDYLKRLLESDAWKIAKTCPKRDGEHAIEILQNWSQGLVASNDAGVGGQGHMSVASAGFGSRTEQRKVFRGSERDSLAGRGIAIVSIPGADPVLYNTVIRICLEDGMHFAVVWLSDWGDAWFYAWLRSVTDAMLHGCVPVVLTWSDGKIGRAQSAEVLALEFLQIKFFTMAMVDFVRVRRPLHTVMVRKEWTLLRRFLTKQNPLPSHESLAMAMKKSDGRGMSPLMVAVDRAAEVGVLRSLVANGADLDQEDNDGCTALDLSNRKCSEAGTMSSEMRSCHSEIKAFLLKCSPPCLEFGICGLDITLDKKHLFRLLTPPRGSRVVPVAAFQLAYQGFPWQPEEGYTLGSSLEERRYPNGATYPAWHEIDDIIAAMPAGTWLSFHLSESKKCPYVSSLLKGDPSTVRLVDCLCGSKYKARHVQININADGVPEKLLVPGHEIDQDSAAAQISELARQYPDTNFLIPIFQKKIQKDTADSWPFFQRVLQTWHNPSSKSENQRAKNIVPFFDNSGGTGKTPDAVPEIPPDDHRNPRRGRAIGFTGGINACNAKEWLARYYAKVQALGPGIACICDAQTGFRHKKERKEPIDAESLGRLMQAVYEWGMPEQPEA